jgi:Kef-type K+ transport system membrane component KefB
VHTIFGAFLLGLAVPRYKSYNLAIIPKLIPLCVHNYCYRTEFAWF